MTVDGALRAPRWADAHRAAYEIGAGSAATRPRASAPLAEAVGSVLAEPIATRTPLPAFDTSAMDGWAVSGPPPWRLAGQVLAGSRGAGLGSGEAVGIATGAEVPPGATAVLRSEHGTVADGLLRPTAGPPSGPAPGRDIRPTGEEATAGAVLLGSGRVVTPAVAGLAAACGLDAVSVVVPPRVALLVLGDELLDSGPSRDGRVRDALGPQLPGWVRGCGGALADVRRVPDLLEVTRDAVAAADAEVVVTTGGTARGPVDHVHGALAALGARLVVDSVAVRPGHPMLLAERGPGRFVVGLPGYPLSAAIGVLTVLRPLLHGLLGLGEPAVLDGQLAADVAAPPAEDRMVPALRTPDGRLEPLPHQGSGMLRGLALADGFALVGPGGAAAGASARFVPLPW